MHHDSAGPAQAMGRSAYGIAGGCQHMYLYMITDVISRKVLNGKREGKAMGHAPRRYCREMPGDKGKAIYSGSLLVAQPSPGGLPVNPVANQTGFKRCVLNQVFQF